jgi:hypothetical protein
MQTLHNLVLTVLMLATAVHAQLLCSPSASVAGTGETVRLTSYDPAGISGTRYTWSATEGKLQEKGAEADWVLDGVKPDDVLTAKVSAKEAGGAARECTLQVQVAAESSTRGDRETARTLLPRNKTEEGGFGLYSYLLFGSRPDDSSRERYLRVVKEYLRLCPPLIDLRKRLDVKQLNVNYLPVMTLPAAGVRPTAEWLLTNYDYARAREILKTVPGANAHYRGPYLLSVFKPSDPKASITGPMFFQDLSTVPLDLVTPWCEFFLNQAAQQRFWEPKAGELLTLKVRTMIGVLARGLPDVKGSLESWIQWLH